MWLQPRRRNKPVLPSLGYRVEASCEDIELAGLVVTAARVALRGLGQPDAFSSGDPALTTALASVSGTADPAPGALGQAAAHWKPWRGYAVTLLLDSLQ